MTPPLTSSFVSTLSVVVLALTVSELSVAEEEGENSSPAEGRHRLDMTFLDVATLDTNVTTDVLLFGYTQAFNSSMRAGVQSGVIYVSDRPSPDSDALEKTTSAGLSDTVLAFQYGFSEKMAASPWIPDTLGLNTQIVVPTGDAVDGLGIDTWLMSIGAGWSVDFYRDIWLVPALGYEFTFAEGDLATRGSRIYGSLPVIWFLQSGFWIGYSLTLSRETEEHEWLDDHTLTIGKMFRNGFGMSLDYGNADRVGPVSIPDDAQLIVNVYYQFGK